ncbi:MAG TPA: Gfo/Idh/MocA family oxidoreductase [Syntrophorhabdaceae bacterium]|nr:Gfo/Idh/MocA family oxidoreductase [Syntrophorhabdaceae bacterium]
MPINIALIGLGHMGRIHLGKLCAFDDVAVPGIVDIDEKLAVEHSQKYSVPSFSDYKDILGASSGAIIATPTQSHFAIAKACLEAGVHVFIEKPITASLEEAQQLVDLAAARGLVLQVGHLERLNPVFTHASPLIRKPLLIEARRISPFTGRSTDVDVVLDLMIHDLDLVISLVGEEIKDISAQGTPLVSDMLDIVSARIEFAGGCVANLTASRVSTFRERSLTVYERDRYFAMDLMQGKLTSITRDESSLMSTSEFTAESMDAVKDELLQFIGAIRGQGAPSVKGIDGLKALDAANRIRGFIADKQSKPHR